MGKIIKWSFLGMATICGAGRGIVETHFNSMPPWDGATSCSMLVLVVINAGYMDMDTLQAEVETGASVPDVSPLLT